MAAYAFRDPYKASVAVELTTSEEDLIASYYRGDTPESAFLLRKDDPGQELFFAPEAVVQIDDDEDRSSRLDVPAVMDGAAVRVSIHLSTETYGALVAAADEQSGGEFQALDIRVVPPPSDASEK